MPQYRHFSEHQLFTLSHSLHIYTHIYIYKHVYVFILYIDVCVCVKHTHEGSQVQASHTCSSVRDDASSAVLPFINTNSPLFVSRLR